MCFFHFCFVFSFLLQERRKRRRRHRRRKPIPSTLRRQEQHRYIILEHSSRVRINHHITNTNGIFRYLLQNIIRKCPFSSENHKTLKLLNVKIQKFKPSGSSSIRTLALRIPDTHHKHHHPFLLLAARGEVCCLAFYTRTHTPHTPLRTRTHALDRRHDKEVLC